MLDSAFGGDTVVLERNGHPWVVILGIERYRQFVESEQELLRTRLRAASAEVSVRVTQLSDSEIDEIIEQAQVEALLEPSRR